MTDPRQSLFARWVRRFYAALLVLIGLSLLAGGVVLAREGGSPYYLVTGLVVTASGSLIWRDDRRGVWLYGAVLIATLTWAIWEVGFEPWQLVLLRHKLWVCLRLRRGARQQGQWLRVLARATMRRRRMVAIEVATCR